MKISIAITVLALAAGCNKGTSQGGGGTSCDAVVARMIELQGREMLGHLPQDKQAKWEKRLRDTLVTSCKDDGWPENVRACVANAKSGPALDADCGKLVSEEQKRKVAARTDALVKEMMQDLGEAPPAAAAPTAPAAEAPTAAAAAVIDIAECAAWQATVDKAQACEKLPADQKEAAKKAIETARPGWTAATTDEAKKSAADACKQADDGLKKSATAAGCTF